MERSVPVDIGYVSGICVPPMKLVFKDEETEKEFTDFLVDEVEFRVGGSVRYNLDGTYTLVELRFVAVPAIRRKDG